MPGGPCRCLRYYHGRDSGNSPVLRVIYAFVEIAFHRRGPEHLPASRFFFAIVLVASVAISLFTIQFALKVAHPIALVVVQGALSMAFTWCLLRAFERERRFLQTASALLGINALLSIVSLSFALWHRGLHVPPDEITVPYVLYTLIAVGWTLDVNAFVVARALDRPYFLGLAIMVGYVLLSASLQITFFPPMSS
jgi:hypothetical protein